VNLGLNLSLAAPVARALFGSKDRSVAMARVGTRKVWKEAVHSIDELIPVTCC